VGPKLNEVSSTVEDTLSAFVPATVVLDVGAAVGAPVDSDSNSIPSEETDRADVLVRLTTGLFVGAVAGGTGVL
jgi:hypothetical protein